MSRCILHVGMHKTGTTSIQRSLAGLDQGGFLYLPGFRGQPNHGRTIEALLDGRMALPDLGGRTLVVSAEAMMTFETDRLQQLARFLETRGFDRIDVIAYVRPPGSYMTSLTNQATRGGAMRNAVGAEPGSGLEIRGKPRYQAWFQKFDQAFGRDNVWLGKFDPSRFPEGCVVRDFCSRLGIDAPVDRIERAQESLPREVAGLLYTYRKLSRDWTGERAGPQENRRLIEQLAAIGATRFRISPSVLRPIIERNRDDIAWMEERLGESLDEAAEEHPDDVRTEAQLMRPSEETVERLRSLFDIPPRLDVSTPLGSARLLHRIAMRSPRRQPG